MSDVTTDEHFGGCPVCGGSDGYANDRATHVFFCKNHRTKWEAGANLFSSWRDESEDEQRRTWNEIGLDSFRNVRPVYPRPARHLELVLNSDSGVTPFDEPSAA